MRFPIALLAAGALARRLLLRCNMAPRLRSASVLHNVLPEEALRVIMLALPVDARARAACVCRSWRAFLADSSLWLVLDLTPAGGVAAERVTENLVRAAVARAAGRLCVFSLNGLPDLDACALLVDVLDSDGAELQELNTNVRLTIEQLDAMLPLAPRLQVLNAFITGQCRELLPLLRNDPPYGPLRVSDLYVRCSRFDVADADVLAFAAAMASHEPLVALAILEVHFARGLNAMVDAAAERRVSQLVISYFCSTDAESISALTRILQHGSLTMLEVWADDFPDANEAGALELWAAVRACRTLTHLRLRLNPPDGATPRTVTELLDAAASLPALSELNVSESWVQDTLAFGHALGALLRANLPNLRTLRVPRCALREEDYAPLLDGLAANTHLRRLQCYDGHVSEQFYYDRLGPALAALAARAALDA